jgi:7,8-dihydropterin-6-yl-methyl-4-(beta-D-ribofuranosyl)aminobenzene 5'-phosphate synthase
MDRATLEDRAVLRLCADPVEVMPGIWTTGEIAPRPEPEGRSRYHVVRKDGGWTADPYRDDLSLVLDTDEGLVVVCGCCHAGLLNTLDRVRSVFGRDPTAVVGGIHLVHADMPTLDRVVGTLRQHGPPRLYVGHCTGERSYLALRAAFGGSVSLCQAGTVLQF